MDEPVDGREERGRMGALPHVSAHDDPSRPCLERAVDHRERVGIRLAARPPGDHHRDRAACHDLLEVGLGVVGLDDVGAVLGADAGPERHEARVLLLVLVVLAEPHDAQEGHVPPAALGGEPSHVHQGLMLVRRADEGRGRDRVGAELQGLLHRGGEPLARELRPRDRGPAARPQDHARIPLRRRTSTCTFPW